MFDIIKCFITFSIAGFIAEFIHCALRGRKSGKLLKGPWCPLYGIGGLIIFLFIKKLPKNILIIYITGVIISSIVEYLTSIILEKIFKKRWWDYTGRVLNINGRICLENSLLFGIMAILLVYIYLPIKDSFNKIIPINIQIIIFGFIIFLILVDAFLIFKNKIKTSDFIITS